MSSITPVGIGGNMPTTPARGQEVASPASTMSSASAPQGDPLSELVSQLSEMLGQMGGGSQGEDLLKMMIGLIMLMSLLGGQQNQNAEQQGMPGQNGIGQNGLALNGQGQGGTFISQQFTQTSITIEQTSIATNAYFADGSCGDSGNQLDALG